jgi:hypothetical protein
MLFKSIAPEKGKDTANDGAACGNAPWRGCRTRPRRHAPARGGAPCHGAGRIVHGNGGNRRDLQHAAQAAAQERV